MKQVAQVLGGIAYTIVFSTILYFITIPPLATVITSFLSLSTFWKVVVLVVAPEIIIGIMVGIVSLAMYPYKWLLEDNLVALILSIGILASSVIRFLIMIWSDTGGLGAWGVIICLVPTFILIGFAIMIIKLMIDARDGVD